MTDNSDYSNNREHSPIARLEKTVSIQKADIKKLTEEIVKFKEWKAEHQAHAERDAEDLKDVRETLYDKDGLCDQARDVKTTQKNVYVIIVIGGIIIAMISNWGKLVP